MKALDTNIIIRFLVNDDKVQGDKVRTLFERAEDRKETLYISIPVLLEVLWVLSSVYDYNRNEIIRAVESMKLMSILEFEKVDTIEDLILIGKSTKHELDDLLIGLVAKNEGCSSTITFDKHAVKSNLFELLK
jgi:predicted nucleic-acid-binding protein